MNEKAGTERTVCWIEAGTAGISDGRYARLHTVGTWGVIRLMEAWIKSQNLKVDDRTDPCI